jgi:hypothetical protein
MRNAPHGTISRYTNQHCRCAECRAAWRAYYANLRKAGANGDIPATVTHGIASTYHVYACRCNDCRTAATTMSRARRDAARLALAADASPDAIGSGQGREMLHK